MSFGHRKPPSNSRHYSHTIVYTRVRAVKQIKGSKEKTLKVTCVDINHSVCIVFIIFSIALVNEFLSNNRMKRQYGSRF